MKPIFVRAGLVLTLALCGCPSDPESPPAGTGGSGGSATGGRGGTGGSSTGGTGGSATGGSGGAGGSATGGSGGRAPDAGRTPDTRRIDAARTPDAGSTTDGGGTAAAVKCGMSEAAFAGIPTAEGLTIAPDGTIYWTAPYSTGSTRFLGRHRPPYMQAPEASFVEVGMTVLGITFDPKRNAIYAGHRGGMPPALLMVDLTKTPPAVTTLTMVEPGINGVILGEDDAVYFTTQDTDNVWRFDLNTKMSQKVNMAPIEGPNGLAFGPDKNLYVLSYTDATVTQLKLSNGVAASQEMFVAIGMNAGNADGIAFDKSGNMYVTANGLFKITPQKVVTRLRAANEVPGANIEFGVGALRCSDMYIAGNGRGISRVMNDIDGLEVPWHRDAQ